MFLFFVINTSFLYPFIIPFLFELNKKAIISKVNIPRVPLHRLFFEKPCTATKSDSMLSELRVWVVFNALVEKEY